MTLPDSATLDDSVFCNLCDPPHETSIAMWPIHMREAHGWSDEDFEAVAEAEVRDRSEQETPLSEPESGGEAEAAQATPSQPRDSRGSELLEASDTPASGSLSGTSRPDYDPRQDRPERFTEGPI